jgi:LEA14-like dessication related protein
MLVKMHAMRRHLPWFRLLLAMTVAVVFAGCAALGPKLQAPDLSIVSVDLVKGDLFEQRIKARMKVKNPNELELAVKGVTYTIELGGEPLGHGLSGSSFIVPAKGEAEFDMLVTVNLAGTLLKLVEKARSSGGSLNQVDYRLRGQVRLERGALRTVPFDEKGVLKLR